MAMATTIPADAQLRQLEGLCRAFYEGSPEEQKHAHDILLPLTQEPQHIGQLQSVLSQSSDLHALIFAANALTKLFTAHWFVIASEQKSNTKKFVLNYLYQRGPTMMISARLALEIFTRLLVRIIKLSWLENIENQNIAEQVNEFLAASTAHWVVGLTIYSELTYDMQPQQTQSFSRQRRIALSFKDTALPKITKVAVTTLQNISLGTMNITEVQEERKLLCQVLQVVNNCFSFDFMGISPDEATEEQPTVMIPLTWDFLRFTDTCKTLFDLYKKSWAASPPWTECARLCIHNLVLLAAFRKSFYDEAARSEQISQFVQGTASVLQEQIGLQDDDCYHHMCRLLGKINASNQLSELAQSPAFNLWLEQTFQFTMKSLENWSHLPNSKHFLLGLWSGMISTREKPPAAVANYIQRVTKLYIESRMLIAEAVAAGRDDDFEDPLSNEVMRAEQLDAVSLLVRCRYTEAATLVADLFDRTHREGQVGAINRETFLQKITWLVYMIGALVGGNCVSFLTSRPIAAFVGPRIMSGSMDDLEGDEDDVASGRGSQRDAMSSPKIAHGELAVRVFQLMSETDKHLSGWSELLELAYLNFLEEFRKYLLFEPGAGRRKDDDIQASKRSSRTCKLMGLQDEQEMTGMIVGKVIYNLQCRTEQESVVKATLRLFMILCSGVSMVHSGGDSMPHLLISGSVLLKNESIKEMLRNHSGSRFAPFLQNPRYLKHRCSYFHSLGRLLFLQLSKEKSQREAGGKLDAAKFDEFMEPFSAVFSQFNYQPDTGVPGASMSVGGVPLRAEELSNPALKHVLVALFRDLRGVALACQAPESYLLFFEWMVNRPKTPAQSRLRLLSEAAQAWWGDPEVIVPLLKLACEMVRNKNNRIRFDATSAAGLVLFKEISSILLTYGPRILAKDSANGDVIVSTSMASTALYREKYKGMAIALEMFGYCLSGNFTNFGVFELYNDSTLGSGITIALKMCLAIPNEDLQAFTRVFRPVCTFLEVVTRLFMSQVMSNLSPAQLAVVLRSVEEGLCAFDNGISMQCCAALDNIVRFLYNNREEQTEEGAVVRNYLAEQSESQKRLLQVVFQLLIAGESTSTWSLSRPLLGLILFHQDEFISIQNHFTQSLQFEQAKRDKFVVYFSELMEDVAMDFSTTNKDRFTKNVFQFIHNMKNMTLS